MTVPPVAHASVAALLLAGGRGRRFDAAGAVDKLMQIDPASGLPLAQAAARALTQAGLPVQAVVRTGADALAAGLAACGCAVVACPHADAGMAESLRCGLAEVLRRGVPDYLLVALADMPWVRPAEITALVDARLPDKIVVPFYQGRRGNPVVFPRLFFPDLMQLAGDVGARGLLTPERVRAVDVAHDGVVRDVDTPGDLGGIA